MYDFYIFYMHLHAIYRNSIILTKCIWKMRTMSSKSLSVKHNFHFILNTPSSFPLASSVVVPISSYLWTSFVCLPLYFRLIIIFSSSFQLSIHSCVSSLHFQVYDSFTWPVPQFSSSFVFHVCLSPQRDSFISVQWGIVFYIHSIFVISSIFCEDG